MAWNNATYTARSFGDLADDLSSLCVAVNEREAAMGLVQTPFTIADGTTKTQPTEEDLEGMVLGKDTKIAASGTGTVSGTVTITGSGTSFESEVEEGFLITADSQTRVVIGVASDTRLTVDVAFAPALSADTFTFSALSNNITDMLVEIQRAAQPLATPPDAPTRQRFTTASGGEVLWSHADLILDIDIGTESSGTGTLVSSGVTVTGTSTVFYTQLKTGDIITADSQNRTVVTIDGNLGLTTDEAFDPVLSADSYVFFPGFPLTDTFNWWDENVWERLRQYLDALIYLLISPLSVGDAPRRRATSGFTPEIAWDLSRVASITTSLQKHIQWVVFRDVTPPLEHSSTLLGATVPISYNTSPYSGSVVSGVIGGDFSAGAVISQIDYTFDGTSKSVSSGTSVGTFTQSKSSNISLGGTQNSKSGTLSKADVGQAITGSGTSFLSDVSIGNTVFSDGKAFIIERVDSNTQILVGGLFTGDSGGEITAGSSYAVASNGTTADLVITTSEPTTSPFSGSAGTFIVGTDELTSISGLKDETLRIRADISNQLTDQA